VFRARVAAGLPLGRIVVGTGECLSVKLENVWVIRSVAILRLGVELLLSHGSSEVGRTLEHGELRNLTSDLLDFLNTRGTGADDAYTFAVDANVFLRPHCCVEANALELVKTLAGWDVVLPGNAGAKVSWMTGVFRQD
jgi:hypothetical protein